ncbi:MAG: agmatinase [Sulfolobaceae archaeon]|nr:agmatinase [Sulfolobaceae archaeon]
MDISKLLYLNESSTKFAGFNKESSPFVIIGAPLDITSSYRPGSRFAPLAIRNSAQTLEFLSLRTGIDIGDIGFNDVGDVIMHPSDVEENINRIASVVSYFKDANKIPIVLGGEHTVTIGSVKGFEDPSICILDFDAHFDLRDEYMGYKYDHACVMRRLWEYGVKIFEIGTRAISREELDFANKNGINYITSPEVKLLGHREVARKVINSFSECKKLYITYDMDALDPSVAPAVATPEPEGLDLSTVLDIVNLVVEGLSNRTKVVGFDVVEFSPPYDATGVTAIVASKLIIETTAIIAKHYKNLLSLATKS